MTITELICKELGLNQNQMDKFESMMLLETLLFLNEEEIEYER